VANVDEHGTVTAVASGHTVIAARSGGLRAEMPVEVDLVERLEARAGALRLTLADQPARPAVVAIGRDGQPRFDREISFTSEDPRIARVDPEGHVWPVNPGQTVVKARVEDKLLLVTVVVTDAAPGAAVAGYRGRPR
jgi:hypothetical protein